ncbi:MAG: molybdopterin-binding protein [Beijerinckiaceae bacterium]
MKFGPVPIADSLGAIVAHSLRRDGFVLKKGETVTGAHVETLAAAGVSEIVVARLEAGDVGENEAAGALAAAISGAHVRVEKPFTGRSNLFAQRAGVLVIDVAAVDRVNEVDETLTVATLEPWKPVVEGEMIGTVKVIPYAAPKRALDAAIAVASRDMVRVAPFTPKKVGVVSTLLPGLKSATVKKTLHVMSERIAPMGGEIVCDLQTPHDTQALTQAIREAAPKSDIVVVFGASAITDRRDVIPAALVEAGGEIEHLGMPVDPGNLLLVGRIAGKPFLGAPGCARSPKENGFDWVLQRLFADIDVRAADIKRMGVGGLLMEIVARGQPREGQTSQSDQSDD